MPANVATPVIVPGLKGGTAAQVLTKTDSTDFNYSFAPISHDVPAGGTTGQVLKKNSNTDRDTGWESLATVATSGLYTDLTSLPTLGTAASRAATDFDAAGSAATAQTNAEAYTDASVVEHVNVVATSGAAQTIPDVTSNTLNDITLNANCTFTFPTAARGKSFTLILTQGSGPFTATWPSSATVKWSGGTAPTLTATSGKQDVITFTCIDGTHWLGFVAGQNF